MLVAMVAEKDSLEGERDRNRKRNTADLQGGAERRIPISSS